MRARLLLALALGWSVGCATAADQAPPAVMADSWQRAQERGIDCRAVGQEPGWYLEVDYQGLMKLVYDYGEREIAVASPARFAGPGRWRLEVMTDAGRVAVLIEERSCSDVMSGEPFPATVTVDIGSRRLEGCRRALAQ